MLDCSQFLEGYSEFRDGRLDAVLRGAFEAHIDDCAACARYHRVVLRGVEIFRELPQLTPSHEFQPRLQHRIFHLQDELKRSGVSPSGTTAAITFVIAALLTATAWIPVLQRPAPALQLPPVAATLPIPEQSPSLFRSAPLLWPGAAQVSAPAFIAAEAEHQLFRGYSPLGRSGMVIPAAQTGFQR